MNKHKKILAFDFGASSGRAILGHFDGERIRLEEVHRFQNDPVKLGETLYWDVLRLYHEIVQGLHAAKRAGGFDSIGIDTWGVDFGFLDKDGLLLENPIHYRDRRTDQMIDFLDSIIPLADVYGRTGIQIIPINSIYQLLSLVKERPHLLERADKALMMPDLFNYFLTGSVGNEYTNASTTQLLDPLHRNWDEELLKMIGISPDLFAPVKQPGTLAGYLSENLCREQGFDSKPVYRVASHDTASAVVAVPAEGSDFIYISSGTWSLMGIETDSPILTEESYRANFTNEGGFGGTIRYLKNIMGLWLIQEARRQWIREGQTFSFSELQEMATKAKPFASIIDPDDDRFASPGDIPSRIREVCRETNQPVPESIGDVVRIIYEGLALKYRETRDLLQLVTHKTYPNIHIIGGGTQNEMLSQFTADATNTKVVTGPIEATALGNIAIQLIAEGSINTLQEARSIIAKSTDTIHYEPKHTDTWDRAYERFKEIFRT